MSIRPGTLVVMLLLSWSSLASAEWKPAEGPLMTRWAKDVSPDNAHPEYPRPQQVRKDWLNLNGLWQYAIRQAADEPPVGKELADQILVPFPIESALSGVMQRADRLWYRRTFEVPQDWQGRRVLLHFGAVDWEAIVYVNGKELGVHRGGYDAFSFDITDALSKDKPQELIVGVYDPSDAGQQPRGKQVKKPHGIFYTPTTGIWQTVWLEPVQAGYIESLKITPDVDGGQLKLKAQLEKAAGGETVEVVVREGDREVARSQGSADQELALQIPDARLWSPESPFLYDLRVAVKSADGKALDLVESYAGMRKVEIAKDEAGVPRIMLNGKFVFQVGPLDQGFWPDGLYTAPTDEALRYDVEITKKLGFNMTRKHVKVEPARWYYWCDKLGLLVWQDMPSGDEATGHERKSIEKSSEAAQQFETELRAMVEQFDNHPSIIMWIVFNEGWGQYDTVRLTEWVKELDPTRLVSCASGWNDFPVGDVIDRHSYPQPAAPESDGRRAAVLGEFGGLGLGVDGHTWTGKHWGYAGTSSSAELTGRYEGLMRGAWQLKDKAQLCAAVYTQITDVETEANGLLTYDRAVIKVDAERAAAANRGEFPELKTVLPTSQQEAQTWKYTFDKPDEGWTKPDFDDSAWKSGPGGFGTEGTPGAVIGSVWNSSDIWLRREFTLDKLPQNRLVFVVHHDENVEIYLNGVKATNAEHFTTDYVELPLTGEAALKSGKNVLAVHCKQTDGGQFIDVGIAEAVPPTK